MNLYHAIGIVLERRAIAALVVVNTREDKIEMLSKQEIIDLIGSGDVFYTEAVGLRTQINVASGPVRRTFLRSARSGSVADNLHSLPRY